MKKRIQTLDEFINEQKINETTLIGKKLSLQGASEADITDQGLVYKLYDKYKKQFPKTQRKEMDELVKNQSKEQAIACRFEDGYVLIYTLKDIESKDYQNIIENEQLNESAINKVMKEIENADGVYNVEKKGNKIYFTVDSYGTDTRGRDWEESFDLYIEVGKGKTFDIVDEDSGSESDVFLGSIEDDIHSFVGGIYTYAR